MLVKATGWQCAKDPEKLEESLKWVVELVLEHNPKTELSINFESQFFNQIKKDIYKNNNKEEAPGAFYSELLGRKSAKGIGWNV